MTSLSAQAEAFARKHHEGQVDKLGVAYIFHVADVASRISEANEYVVAIAWLHDVVEDTEATLNEIEQMFGARVRDGVDAMTKRAGEDYFVDYLPRLMKNPDAVTVKVVDASHNLAKVPLLRERDPLRASSLEKKYREVLSMLGAQELPHQRLMITKTGWQSA